MSRVKMNKEGIFIDDKAKIVLCGSLFYYRIPSALWEDRMIKIKAAGYNCIDVYFPWNFHELSEGEWDFSGMRDVEQFLKLAKKHDLMIMARPGPYICGEWDGGGLPSYLYTKEMDVRDNDDLYLEYVEEWYKRIIPIIAKYQVDQEGTVINLQVENELDFYKVCKDPKGYIGKLRDMAIKYGITVPIIACVGYFDIEKATGYASDVIPTMNIYPDGDNPKWEAHSVKYTQYMADRDYPLMVTETNRNHHMLRRLMLNGTKLLGPFNQVGGTAFGFTNAVNNWGKPLSFLASDYNFGGLVNGQGEVNHEFYQARLLGNFIELFKEKIGRSQLVEKEINFLHKEDVKNYPYMLELFEGGYLTTATNYLHDEENIKVKIDDVIYPKNGELKLKKLQAPFLLVDTPLDFLGINLTVKFSSLEFSQFFKNDEESVLVLYTNDVGEIQFDIKENDVEILKCDGKYEFDSHLIINLGQKEECIIKYQNQVLRLVTLDPKEASLVKNIKGNHIEYIKDLDVKSKEYTHDVKYSCNEISLDDFTSIHRLSEADVKHLEQYGSLTGFGNYQFTFKKDEEIKGLLINEVSDICSVYLNKQYKGTDVTFNNHHFISLSQDEILTDNEVLVKTEIWGHTNFHDIVLPSLVMDSLKGLTGLTLIKEIKDLDLNFVEEEKQLKLTFNCMKQEYERIYLRLKMNDYAKLELNGKDLGVFNTLNDICEVTNEVLNGDNELILHYREELTLNKIELLKGYNASFKNISIINEKDLLSVIDNNKEIETNLPYQLASGKMAVLNASLEHVDDKCLYALIEGKNLKVTAFYNYQLVSRVWVNSTNGPRVVGGNAKMIYLPNPYSQENGNFMKLFIEAINKEEPTELTSVKYLVIDE